MQGCLNEARIKNPMGGEARGPRERKGKDEWMILLGRSHGRRSEAEYTLTMISHGVEISIGGGGADENDEKKKKNDEKEPIFFISYIRCYGTRNRMER